MQSQNIKLCLSQIDHILEVKRNTQEICTMIVRIVIGKYNKTIREM